MKTILALVSLISFLTYCQSVTVRDADNFYEAEPKRYIYPESEVTPETLGQEAQIQYYKAARRSGRVPAPAFQYAIPEDPAEGDYSYPPQQPSEARAENVPSLRSYEQEQAKRLGVTAKKPSVEQYLKEVTPTTKTAYNRRAGNYLRSNGQVTVRGNKQQSEETQRSILKQSPYQYVLQSELQQKPQIQYEIPDQKPIQHQQIPQQQEGLSRYQNALLAHQKVLLETSGQEESKSSIYVNHAIPKKPVRKLKQSPVDEDVDFYTQLQQYQQQLQQQKQPQFYEQQQPAQVMYQSKLQQPKEEAAPQATPGDTLTYQQQHRQFQPQILQYQPPPTLRQVPAKKVRRPVKYQQEYRTIQEGSDPSYQYQVSKQEEPTPERLTSFRQGPKYLPEPKGVRYQPSLEEGGLKYQQTVVPGPQQALISYEAALAKLQSEQARARPPGARQPSVYRESEQAQAPKYQLQYAEESQQGANQEGEEVEYVRPEQASRLRPVGKGAVYRQPIQGSNVRYYRNLGRPVSYTSYE